MKFSRNKSFLSPHDVDVSLFCRGVCLAHAQPVITMQKGSFFDKLLLCPRVGIHQQVVVPHFLTRP